MYQTNTTKEKEKDKENNQDEKERKEAKEHHPPGGLGFSSNNTKEIDHKGLHIDH